MATMFAITQALVDLLRDNWQDLELEGREDVYYGDQPKLAHHPSITVEATDEDRPLTGTGMITTVTTTVYIMIYHSALKNIQVKREEIDRYQQKVQDLIHANKKLGGIIIHGHVLATQTGFADRSGTMMRTVRQQYEAISRESIWS